MGDFVLLELDVRFASGFTVDSTLILRKLRDG